MMHYAFAALIGYLLGCLNMAWFLSKIKGFDIRSHGSNNAGASNAAVTMGFKAGAIVAVHDVAKALLAASLAGLLFPALPAASAVAGVAAVIGHIFPFYLKFRGGKGFAPFLGLTLALDWRFFLLIILAALFITLIFDYIALATLTTAVSVPVYLFFTQAGLLVTATVCVASCAILCKHFVNIKRIITGQEIGLRRTLSKKDRI